MDHWAGNLLAQLDADALADDIIVFFYSDHGVGLPRGKRWLYDAGLRVPLLIRCGKNVARYAPGKPGSSSDRLVSFVDFAPTVLSVANVKPAAAMQGAAFLGVHAVKPREAIYAARDRMDERDDCSRAVRDVRYKYIRNYRPDLPWAQPLAYMELMPTMAAWRHLAASEKLAGSAALWLRSSKPFEELYDCEKDLHEIVNIADRPAAQATLQRLRQLHLAWYKETRDLGLIPEAKLQARAKGRTRYDVGHDAKAFPSQRLRLAAEHVAKEGKVTELIRLADDAESGVRWWALTGLAIRGGDAPAALLALPKGLADTSPVVRVAVADGLGRRGRYADALTALQRALRDPNPWVRHQAALVADAMGTKAAPLRKELIGATKDDNAYVVSVARHALASLPAAE